MQLHPNSAWPHPAGPGPEARQRRRSQSYEILVCLRARAALAKCVDGEAVLAYLLKTQSGDGKRDGLPSPLLKEES